MPGSFIFACRVERLSLSFDTAKRSKNEFTRGGFEIQILIKLPGK